MTTGAITGGRITSSRARRGRWPLNLVIGLVMLTAIVALSALAALIVPFDVTKPDLTSVLLPPSAEHLLGTDNLGRDILGRILHGARVDLGLALLASILPLALGTGLGIVAAYFGKWVDNLIMRTADVAVAFPYYVIVIALVFALDGGPVSILIAITAVSWVSYARLVRGETLALRQKDFIAAARASGLSHTRIIFRHVIPNVSTQSVVFLMSDIVLNIGVIVTLNYLGLGIAPPTPNWGQMIADGQALLLSGNYAMVLYAGLAIVITSLALSLVGDGIADSMRVKR